MYGKSVREPLKMIACLVIACIISWRLLLFSMLLAPVGGAVVYYFGKRMKRAACGETRGFAALFQVLLESLNGIKLVRIFAGQRRERLRFRKAAGSLYKMQTRISFFDALIRPINEITAIAVLSTAVLCGAFLVLGQRTDLFGITLTSRPLSAGEMFAFFAMLAGIADPARKMSDIYNVMLRAVLMNSALYRTFEKAPKVACPVDPSPTPLHRECIRFENVTFAYRGGPPVLRRVNLEIPFGQTVAIVGANGSGKSTLGNLVARCYDPRRGSIYIDGVDLRDIRPRQLRRQIGIVTQDPFLFDDTVLFNIRYGKRSASDAEVRWATEISQVDEFTGKLPSQLETKVGEGGRALSGGQRQRVALARAILKDPRILILDEATSQLDAQTEAAVLESLRDFLKRRTTIIITHRLSTVALADRVVVLQDGSIVKDFPTHDMGEDPRKLTELLAKAA
jgi:ATP-binding cassette subfamily B protein/subfamily B ATP-binding cassette protein MsbA